jgi:hypothetical protein
MSSEASRPAKPIYPHGEETQNYRYGRSNVGYHRDEGWLAIVRTEPCMHCGHPGPSDPHHVFGGLNGIKHSDLACIPLCRQCHEAFERDRALKDRGPVMLAVFLVKLLAKGKGLE